MKIFVTYHKETPLIKNEVLTPIHAGAALSDKQLNMIGDNTGDHISEKNPYWCELTVLYWMWKNIDTDYYGLFHYRRMFAFKRRADRYFMDASPQTLDNLGLGAENIKKECEGYDFVSPPKWAVRPTFEPDNLMTTYDFYAQDHIENDLKVAIEVIREKYPEYARSTQIVMNQKKAYFCNMFIMRKQLFQKYASWLFDVLFEVEKRIAIQKDDAYQKRVFGFLAERLMNVFMFHEQCVNPSLKIKETRRMPFGVFDGKFPYEQMLKMGRRWEVALKCEVPYQTRVAQPLVSVIIFVGNAGKYLPACLNSIVYQSLKAIEIIAVVNAGSTDGLAEILQEYASKDKRMTVVHEENEGVSSAKKSGMKHAQGKYLFFVNGCDYIERKTIEEMFEKAESTDAQIVCCTTKQVDAETEKTVADAYDRQTHFSEAVMQKSFSAKFIAENFFDMQVPAWNKLYLKDFLETSSIISPENGCFEGHVFFVQTMLNAEKISFLDVPYYVHRTERKNSAVAEDCKNGFDSFKTIDDCEAMLKASKHWGVLKNKFLEYKVRSHWYWCNLASGEAQEAYYSKLRGVFLSSDLSEYDLKEISDEAFNIYVDVVSHAKKVKEKPQSRKRLKKLGRSIEHFVKQVLNRV